MRARVEHVFGSQHTSMKIGMQNLAYNMRRLVVLERGMMAGP